MARRRRVYNAVGVRCIADVEYLVPFFCYARCRFGVLRSGLSTKEVHISIPEYTELSD